MFSFDKTKDPDDKNKIDDMQELSVSDADDDFDDRYIHLSKSNIIFRIISVQ